jgi:hypothetical protein
VTERDRRTLRRIVSRNHTTAAAQVTGQKDWIFILKNLFPHKLSYVIFTSPNNIHGRATIAKPPMTESNAQMRKRWCHYHKTLTSHTRKRTRDIIRRVVLHTVPHTRKSLRFENTLQFGMPGSNSETRGRFCDCLDSNIVFCWSHYYPSWLKYCKGVRGQVG